MSTVVICSGCEKKVDKNTYFKVGVATDLLSFDPFSFQSLGERDVIDLLYTRLFEIEKNEFVSDHLKNLKVKNNEIIFSPMSEELFFKAKEVFSKGRRSVLWKDTFKKFKLQKNKIIYLKEKNFITEVKALWPLLILKDTGKEAYEVIKHKKGVFLTLKAKRNDVVEYLKIIRVKENQTGLDMLLSKDLDVYFPLLPFTKGVLKSYKNFEALNSKKETLKLRMYSKFGEMSALQRSYCDNKKEFEKILGKGWVLEKENCENLKIDEKKEVKLIYSQRSLMKYLDFLHNKLKEDRGVNLNYDLKSSLELTKSLKMGQFDHHLSLEKVSEEYPVPFESLHSKGSYNSYRIKDETLDKELEVLSKATNLKDYEELKEKVRGISDEVLPLIFSYTRPSIQKIKLKSSLKYKAKSSKTLIFFK